MQTKAEENIGDLFGWSSEEISNLWKEMDRLRLRARAQGWEEEFLSNVKEWVYAGGELPVSWLLLRRKDWY
jgi:hypothetical protein